MEKAVENLNQAVFSALESLGRGQDIRFESSCFGSAALNVKEDYEAYSKIVRNDRLIKYLNQEKVLIYNDTRIGLEAGSRAENKIILIAGTGSNCLGINEKGEEAKCSGWDYILADEGSGFEVSIRALRAVIRAFDGRGSKTLLTGAVLKEVGLKDELGLVGWVYGKPFTKERLGVFARTACQCAARGDTVSREILKDEAREAVLSVTTVAEKLKLEEKAFDLVFVGGLFRCEEHFKDIVTDSLKQRFEMITFRPLVAKPVEGAVRLARDNL